MLAKVRYTQGDEFLEVVGVGRIVSTDAGLVANRSVLERAGMTSLREALVRYEFSWGSLHGNVHVTGEREDEIDDESQVDEISLVFDDGRLLAQAFIAVETQPDEQVILSLAAPLLARNRASIVEIVSHEEKWGWAVWLTLEVPIRRKSVGDALRLADLIYGAIVGAYPAEFDFASAAAVIRARHPELLVGVFESEWLDAKRSPYRLDEKGDQYELAKDVASFANQRGGLILIGAKTKRRREGDEIHAINGCRLPEADPVALRSVIQRRIYPRVERVSIDRIPLSSPDAGVVMIEIPPQQESQKPFLVSGTKSGSRLSELGFTHAVREGESTVAPRIEVVHQLIRAGKAALAGDASSSTNESLGSDVQLRGAERGESWMSDIVFAAVKAGFNVERNGDSVTFRRGDVGPLVAAATAAAPPADVLQRQILLEGLAELGLPVQRTVRGLLRPEFV
jgi:hypothetical protein